MSINPVSLAARRAMSNSRAADWSPVECLRYLADRIEAGEESADSVMVALLEGGLDDDRGLTAQWWYAGPAGWVEHLVALRARLRELEAERMGGDQ